MDALLAAFAPAEAALRLRLGQVLDAVGRGAHFELGFSSVAAYALERCDRSVRWVEAARCLARRVEQLPELRRAMTLGGAFGRVSWSMGELLARVAQPQDERRWVEAAQSRTVREMQVLVLETMRRADAGSDARPAGSVMPDGRSAGDAESDARARALVAPARENADGVDGVDGDAMCTLTCTVDQEEAWLFEATRALLEQLGTHGAEAQVEALLAEGQGTLLAALPAGTLDMDRLEGMDRAQQRWLQELGRWRAEAEALCEEHIRESVLGSRKPEPVYCAVAVAAAVGMASLESANCHELDGTLRDLSRMLARHELELSRLILQFHEADGWRRLGYASEAQYARERLGMSRSALVARRALALRLEALPRVAEALGSGQIGVEAALQVVRVATPSTQAAWVMRAEQRTIKLLREEVAAALTAVRISGEAECPPPVDAEMVAFHALEQAVVSGRACRQRSANDAPMSDVDGLRLAEPVSEPRRAWLVMLGSLTRWLDGGLRMSAGQGRSTASSVASSAGRIALRMSAGQGRSTASSVASSAGRIALRLRVSRSTHAWWRGLEAQARRWLPCGMSWLRFLCLSLWQAWRHLLGADVKYGQIYIRDRHRCMSPVCGRKDVTPHHLQFRSAGGSDEDHNVGSVCTWCHLHGVHGGRIRATGSADCIRWELGPSSCPCLLVDGRERVAA